jgi:hypothetical protein
LCYSHLLFGSELFSCSRRHVFKRPQSFLGSFTCSSFRGASRRGDADGLGLPSGASPRPRCGRSRPRLLLRRDCPGHTGVACRAARSAGRGRDRRPGAGRGGEVRQEGRQRRQPSSEPSQPRPPFFSRGQSGTHARLAPRDFSRGLEIDQSERLVLFIPSELLDNTCLQPA